LCIAVVLNRQLVSITPELLSPKKQKKELNILSKNYSGRIKMMNKKIKQKLLQNLMVLESRMKKM
jgi:hypothetical protein